MNNKKVNQEVEITGDGNVVGDGSVAQVAKAAGGGTIGDVKQIAFVIQGAEAGQAVAMELGEVRRLIEEVRAYLPTKSQWTVTESGEDRLAVETRHPVTAPLHFRLQSLIEDYTALFAGRKDEIAEVEAFLQRSEGGYVFVTGKSGCGKTALLANLIAKKRPPIREQERTEPGPYIYHFLSYLRGTHRREDMLRNLCQQMMAYYQIEGRLPSRLDDLEALYTRLIHLPLVREDRPFVLMIDGIDEADDGFISNLHIPAELPAGKTLVFSARETGVDWLSELGIPRDRAHILRLKRFGARGVRQLLREAGGHAEELAENKTFIKQVLDISEGEPFYLRYLAEDIRDGAIGKDNIGRQPKGLSRYLDGWWRELSAQVREEEARQLLGLLLVARAPLPRSDILDIYPELTWGLDGILQASRRFIVGNDERGYALCHPRFREHLADKLETVVAKHRQTLLDYCARWREHESTYVLRHYVAHLVEVGDKETLSKLLTREWADARRRLDGDYAGFLEDIERIWKLAGEQRDIGLQARCASLKSTIHTLATNLPVELIIAAVEEGVWRPHTAINIVYQISEEEQLATGLTHLAPHLSPALMEEALDIVKRIKDIGQRDQALAGLASDLPSSLVNNALEMAQKINEETGSIALALLAPRLSPDTQDRMLDEALESASRIEDDAYRSIALAELADHLPPALRKRALRRALGAVRGIKDEYPRAMALMFLASRLPSSLAGEILDIVRELDNETCSTLLVSLAQNLSDNSQEQIVREALSRAREIKDKYTRCRILLEIVPHLSSNLRDQVLDEVLDTAHLMEDAHNRSKILAALTAHLSSGYRRLVVLESALLDASSVVENMFTHRSEVLADLVPLVPSDLREKVLYKTLDAASGLEDKWRRSRMLAGLVPHLPSSLSPDLRERVLHEAVGALKGVKKAKFRNEALATLAPHLPRALLEEALILAQVVGDQVEKEASLSALKPYVSDHHKNQPKSVSESVPSLMRWENVREFNKQLQRSENIVSSFSLVDLVSKVKTAGWSALMSGDVDVWTLDKSCIDLQFDL